MGQDKFLRDKIIGRSSRENDALVLIHKKPQINFSYLVMKFESNRLQYPRIIISYIVMNFNLK